ncbi:MAG: methionine--tRNA ligase [candidate division WOR-3 bacterium]
MKTLVTSALPYANGEIHFGHLAGAYLPADIYVKYLRLKGADVVYICGSDEHGVPITLAAQKEGLSPQATVDKYHPSIKRSFEQFGIEFDNYSRTSLPIHHQTAQEFFLKVYEKGLLEPRTTRQLYCPSCRMFLADRYVEGICPSCGSDRARGDQCEACGKWIEPFDLVNPRCKTCGARPEVRETRHWFFLLSRLESRLRKWLAGKPDWKPNVKRFCEGWFARGLQDRAVTRDLPWGVPVPLPEAQGKVMYVWFDAPIGYISSTKEWAANQGRADRWKDYWLDEKTRLVHFIGKDNIVFHAIVWPAMLMAHEGIVLPAEIPANEFLNLEGDKLSTSRNWAVWLPDYLAQFPADPLRYALAVNLPENRDVDFTWRDFRARNNDELADVLGNFVNRVAVFIQNNYAGRVPDVGAEDESSLEVLRTIERATAEVGTMIETFRIKDAARRVMTLAALGNRYFDYQAPWRSFRQDRDKCDRTMAVCMRLVSSFEILLYPFLPFTSRKLAAMLGLGPRLWDDAARPTLPAQLGPVAILFTKIGEEKIAEQVARLGPARAQPGFHRPDTRSKEQRPARSGPEPGAKEKPMISYDEWRKVELRTARITAAERVSGTEKLVKMMIDLGTEQRQIVAGIGKGYAPDELVGRTIIVVANLKPAKIRGVESNGMLLAAVDGDQLALLTVDRPVAPGTGVS